MGIDSKRSRWHITGRVLLGTFGGYLFANSVALFLVFALPMERLHAIITMTFLSFLLWTVAILWVFSVDKVRSVAIGMMGSTVLCGAGAIVLYSLETGA
ncbi:MAG: hypothetical protein AAGI24_03010 [Pseudomonadota bacterium]